MVIKKNLLKYECKYKIRCKCCKKSFKPIYRTEIWRRICIKCIENRNVIENFKINKKINNQIYK